MKKFFVICMTLMLAVSAMAQESNRTSDGKVQYGPYETNRFFDNVFVGVGGGANFGLDRLVNEDATSYVHGWGLDAEAYVGKYLTPEFGVRLGWQGHNVSWAEAEDAAQWQWPFDENALAFNYVHADFLWNLTNQFGGYKETRFLSVVPYLHAGFLWGHEDRTLGVGAGIEFPLRVSNRVAIVPDFRVLGTQAAFIHPNTTGIAQVATASLSVRVTLGKTNWTRKATTVAYYSALVGGADVALRDAKAAVEAANARAAQAEADKAALAKENEALTNALNDCNNRKCNNDALSVLQANPLVLYFEIGKTTLTEKELAHLARFVETAGTAKVVNLVVAGGTDTKTGTAKRNEYLRNKRAEYVRNLLVNQYGFAEENVKIGDGLTDIDTPALSRVAIVSCE